jgi:hypothetical protein
MYYNEEEIFGTSKMALDDYDDKWFGRVGEVEFFTQDAVGPGGFLVYKADADEGRWQIGKPYGTLRYVDSDSYTYSTSSNYGVLRSISGDIDYLLRGKLYNTDPPYGTIRQWFDPKDNVEIVYAKVASDIDELPKWTHKYVAFGCLAALLSEDTEGQNLAKAGHYNQRYTGFVDYVRMLIQEAKGHVPRVLGQPCKIHVLGEGI